MSKLERAARREWRRGASWMGFSRCDGCGDYAYVARQARSTVKLCLRCWDGTR